MSGTYPITGIPVAQGQNLPLRREITAWFNDTSISTQQQVSLFMRALTNIQQRDVQDLLAYFQLAGIHCYPTVGWDGVPGVPNPKSTDDNPGFCAHNMITFPTWHRPYMLLYEQVLYEEMINIINAWSLVSDAETEWCTAASQFRLPYWDWAAIQSYTNGFGIPEVCTLDEVNIVDPVGKSGSESILNPLAKYTNTMNGKPVPMGDPAMGDLAIKDDADLPWSKCIGTSRYGITDIAENEPFWVPGINNWHSANVSIANPPWSVKGQAGTFADAVACMLSPGYFQNYDQFASTLYNATTDSTNTDYLSIEYIHNVVHNATGGQFMDEKEIPPDASQPVGLGHMSDVPVAAFDPIFWLHHANVDRLLATFQTLNPSMWMFKIVDTDPSPDDGLLPFHSDDQGTFWTSNQARDWKKLYYSYDTLAAQAEAATSNGTLDAEQYMRNVRADIHERYPSTIQVANQVPGYTTSEGKFHDYIINIIYDRYALEGRAYSILFFLGDVPSKLGNYVQHPNYLGQVYTFSAPIEVDGAVACANCARQNLENSLSKAQVRVTIPLISRVHDDGNRPSFGSDPFAAISTVPSGDLLRLEPEVVEKVLEKGLNWIFVQIGGQRVDHTSFPRTEIAVMHGTGRTDLEIDDPTPRFTGYRQLRRCTLNNPTGSGHPENALKLIRDDGESERAAA